MVALLLLFALGPGMRSKAEKLRDQFAPAHKAAKGFKAETFLVDDIAGEYGSLTLWESKGDIEAFRKAAGPQLAKALSGIAKRPPSTRLFEVYTPKSNDQSARRKEF